MGLEIEPLMPSVTGIKRVSAYAAIYLLWGGAYLAVRVLVHVVPPFLVAGIRYSLAALLLVPVIRMRGARAPNWRQLLNAFWTGVVMLGVGYGVVFWAEKRLPSWVVAVLMSTTFLWTYMGECLVLRSYRFRGRMLAPLLMGLAGMPWLVGGDLHADRVSILAVLAVLLGAFCWSAGSLAVKRVDLPHSYLQTAALQLASSGLVLLCFSGALGEWTRLPAMAQIFAWKPVMALAYLVFAASMLGMAAFHWLMTHEPASLVATSAYVNPMVAMMVGIVAANERCSLPQLGGACGVVASIVTIWYFQMPASQVEMGGLSAVPDL
jgi:drug/metabolite transporter (DMT)-like permease